MTNGEEEKKEEVNQVPDQSPPAETKEEVNQVPSQSPPAKSSKNPIIFVIIGLLAICCVGVIVVVALGGGSFEFNLFDTEPKYTNETVSGYTFKMPVGFEKMKEDVNGMVEFKNDTNKFVRINGITEKYDLYSWSLAVSAVLGGITGNKVDLNGTPAYRFETEDVIAGGPTEQTIYVYALNLDGKSFIIILSKGIENPNDFLTNMTSAK